MNADYRKSESEFIEGYIDRRNGGLMRNPYVRTSLANELWRDGWIEADKELAGNVRWGGSISEEYQDILKQKCPYAEQIRILNDAGFTSGPALDALNGEIAGINEKLANEKRLEAIRELARAITSLERFNTLTGDSPNIGAIMESIFRLEGLHSELTFFVKFESKEEVEGA